MGDSSEEETILTPPCEFGRFMVERELGHGGMGGVYLARDKMLDRQVALKVMLKSLGADPQFLERFKREAQAAAKLIHPSIAQIYAYDIVEGQPYIAMEMAGGGSLLKLMDVHGGNIDPTRVMRVCKQIAEGLSCAADQGLVHGDIKPENILFDASGAAKIVDFGLAGMQDDNSGDEIWGTPYYIAPEKVLKGPTDFRVDMYSLGATIYHAITGVAPFEGSDPNEVVKARFTADPKPPSEARPGLRKSIDKILMKMMAREVIDRYPTWEACIGDINRALAEGVDIDVKAEAAAAVAKDKPSGGDGAKTGGGKRLVMRGRKKFTVKKDQGEDESGTEAGESAEGGKKQMTIGRMIVLGIVSIIGITVLAAGGIVWYIKASNASQERERMALIQAKTAEAKAAIETTLKSSHDFAGEVAELCAKSEKEVKSSSDAFLAMLDPEMRETCRPELIPPEAAEYVSAIAYSNKVAEKIAEADSGNTAVEGDAAAAGTNAPPVAAGNKVADAPASGKVKSDLPPQLKAFRQLWDDLWIVRAAEVRVNASVMLIEYKAAKSLATKVEDAETATKLAKVTADLVEEFESMKSQKEIEKALKKAGAIRQKAPTLVTTTKQQIDRAKAKAAKLAADKAAAEAAAAAKKKAEEEHEAKVEAEIEKAKERYEALALKELKRLDWDFAMRQMGDLTNGFEKLTREGNLAVADQLFKISCMRDLQRHFIKNGKGMEFGRTARYPKGTKIAATDADSITLQRPAPKPKSLKDKPVLPKPERIAWKKFYFEQPGMLNDLIIELVQDRSKNRIGLKEWSNLMFGAALTMQTLFPDTQGVPDRVKGLVEKAVEDFENCSKQAERIFPELFPGKSTESN